MKNLKGPLILLMTSIIWGLAFMFQSKGMDHIGPLVFNTIRFGIGAIILLITKLIIFFVRKHNGINEPFINKPTLYAGLLCGVFVFLGSTFQQVGIVTTDSGKAGFITALYILFVPILGLILKKKTSWNGWVSVIIALCGFFFLSLIGGITNISIGDIYLLGSAIMFASQILTVDHFAERSDPIMVCLIQFAISTVCSFIASLFFESWTIEGIVGAKWSILYTGVLSCGIAYALQMIGQKYTKPSVASLILSLESVVAIIAGVLFLNETLLWNEIIGCILIFIAIIFSQVTFKKNEKHITLDEETSKD
ncbi:MAG: DMT family transporter [Bacilli bacterium]